MSRFAVLTRQHPNILATEASSAIQKLIALPSLDDTYHILHLRLHILSSVTTSPSTMAPPGLALPGSDHPSIKYPTGAPINLQCCPNKPNNVERMGYFSDNPLLRRLRSVSKDGEPHPCENGILEPKGAIFDNDPTLGQPRSSDPAEGSLSLVQQVQEPWNYEKEKVRTQSCKKGV